LPSKCEALISNPIPSEGGGGWRRRKRGRGKRRGRGRRKKSRTDYLQVPEAAWWWFYRPYLEMGIPEIQEMSTGRRCIISVTTGPDTELYSWHLPFKPDF
jgi:hypothetical protein